MLFHKVYFNLAFSAQFIKRRIIFITSLKSVNAVYNNSGLFVARTDKIKHFIIFYTVSASCTFGNFKLFNDFEIFLHTIIINQFFLCINRCSALLLFAGNVCESYGFGTFFNDFLLVFFTHGLILL